MGQTATAASLAPPIRRGRTSAWADRHFKWLMVAPAVLIILAFSIYPLLFSLWVAFVNYDFQVPGHAFVGLQNFQEIIDDPLAWSSLGLTIALSVTVVAIEFVLGLALALAMVKTFRGRGTVMSILIIPLFISPVIVGQSWALFLQRPFGPADYLLSQLLGRQVEISWVGQVPWVYFSIVVADVWQWTPFMFVILLAGLAAIPPHLYEAAELDGVGAIQSFRYVTLPQLAPVMLLAVTLRLLDAVKLFERHLHVDWGRPGHVDLHGLVLSVPDRVPAVSPVDGDGGKLDVSNSVVRGDHRARTASFESGDSVMAKALPSLTAQSRRAGLARAFTIGLFVIFVLVPLYWVVITSIKPSSDYLTTPPVWFPARPTIVHYTAALFSYRGLQGLINSLIIASAATVLSTLIGTMMAYSLARFNTGGQHLALWVLSQRFLPPVAIVLPIFLLFRTWGLYDTLTGLILAYTFMTLPLSVWMMFAYFKQLPKSLEEAAWVDGLSRWQTFWMVATPLAAPGVAAAAVFVFIAAWTEFFFALILTSRHAFTLPTIFRAFLGFQGAQYGEACALATTSLVPSIVLGMLVQRHLVRGLTLGAIRG